MNDYKPPRPGKFTGTPRSSEIHPETGLSFPQIRCLRAVRALTARGRSTTQEKVAARLGVWKRAAETVLERLRARGLVDWRAGNTPGHCQFCGGRLNQASLRLTEVGEVTLATIPRNVARYLR